MIYDMIWYDMTWHDIGIGIAWHGMTWHGMTWHDMTWLVINSKIRSRLWSYKPFIISGKKTIGDNRDVGYETSYSYTDQIQSNLCCPGVKASHYDDIIWASWRLKSPSTSLFVQQLLKLTSQEASKLHISGPLWAGSPRNGPIMRREDSSHGIIIYTLSKNVLFIKHPDTRKCMSISMTAESYQTVTIRNALRKLENMHMYSHCLSFQYSRNPSSRQTKTLHYT